MSSNLVNQRVNFATVKSPMPYPDFLDVQLKSFKDFLQLDTPPEKRKNDGLYKVFSENFPIADTRNNFVLEFLDYYIDPPRYTIEECLERGLTYSVPLKAKLKISRISLSSSKPMARNKVVTGNFFLRSIYAYMTLLMSVANSIHEPLNGMIRAEYSCVPFA